MPLWDLHFSLGYFSMSSQLLLFPILPPRGIKVLSKLGPQFKVSSRNIRWGRVSILTNGPAWSKCPPLRAFDMQHVSLPIYMQYHFHWVIGHFQMQSDSNSFTPRDHNRSYLIELVIQEFRELKSLEQCSAHSRHFPRCLLWYHHFPWDVPRHLFPVVPKDSSVSAASIGANPPNRLPTSPQLSLLPPQQHFH